MYKRAISHPAHAMATVKKPAATKNTFLRNNRNSSRFTGNKQFRWISRLMYGNTTHTATIIMHRKSVMYTQKRPNSGTGCWHRKRMKSCRRLFARDGSFFCCDNQIQSYTRYNVHQTSTMGARATTRKTSKRASRSSRRSFCSFVSSSGDTIR